MIQNYSNVSSNKLSSLSLSELDEAEVSLKEGILGLFDFRFLYDRSDCFGLRIFPFAQRLIAELTSYSPNFGPSSAIRRRLSNRVSVNLDLQFVFICFNLENIFSNFAFVTGMVKRSSTKIKTSDQALLLGAKKYTAPNLSIVRG